MVAYTSNSSVSIVAFADQNPYSQMYGIMLRPVSIAFILYALRQCAFLRCLKLFYDRPSLFDEPQN